ncbi:MAG TPA: hypothetical protein VFA28_12325 [Bryobacteraceae bacterium]|jgi:hypothetical protein|nr:hypothetical protein [Bryobacteraceae bacterium]
MRVRFTLIGLAAAATLAAQGPGGRLGGFGGPGGRFGAIDLAPHGAPVTGAPYSALETTQMVRALSGGNQIQRQDQSKVYRDSQGRVRTEHTFTPPPGAANQTARTTITIYDPVAGTVTVLDPQNKTAFQRKVNTSNRPTSAPRTNTNQNVQTQDLGTQIVNGVSATGTRTTLTIPAGAVGNTQPIQVVREVWTSTDLKVPVLIKITDPRFGDTTTQLTNIVRAEPDPSLFQIPSDYTVKTGPAGRGPRGWRANH